MVLLRKKVGLQARWSSTLLIFVLPFLLFFSLRWLWYEPFVIPSESMVPNLFIHDYILVQKTSYGIKPPLGDGWWWFRNNLKRGDVIVFRFPENREIFYIKRLVGLPGDHIEVQGPDLFINGVKNELVKVDDFIGHISNSLAEQKPAEYFEETFDQHKHFIRIEGEVEEDSNFDFESKSFDVPAGKYFVMGDNRYNSYDSRYWGFVPQSLVVGRAKRIWLSCGQTLENAPMICDPRTIRLDRLLKPIL